MTSPLDTAALARALGRQPGFSDIEPDQFAPMPGHGVAHDHVRVSGVRRHGVPVLLRIPRLSQWGLTREFQLDYEAACFERAEPSGRTPRYFGALPIDEDLPWGALVVEAIEGRKPTLPGEMSAVAETLAAIHTLPLPPRSGMPPLQHHDDPAGATLAVIREQATFLDRAELEADSRAQIEEELAAADAIAAASGNLPDCLSLVVTDAHPGNYLIDAGGRAMFVDLEKALYGLPAIDLAHATLHTSTMWDPDIATSLSLAETRAFYEDYLGRIPGPLATGIEPWLRPARRLTWLRTITWMVRWSVLSTRDDSDWSADTLSPGLRDYLRRTVDNYLRPGTIEAVRESFEI